MVDVVKPRSRSNLNVFDGNVDASSLDGDNEECSFLQKRAVHMANHPCTYLWSSLVLALILSFSGMYFGNFKVTLEDGGWNSRGTLIADRHSQFLVTFLNRERLFEDTDDSEWQDVINNVQPGWEGNDDDEDIYNDRARRSLSEAQADFAQEMRASSAIGSSFVRKLQEQVDNSTRLSGCNLAWYKDEMLKGGRLWPIWRPKKDDDAILLSKEAIRDLCLAEEKTQLVIEAENLCADSCDSGCLPPFSLVLFARMTVENGMDLDCEDLSEAWSSYATGDVNDDLTNCALSLESNSKTGDCSTFFSATMVDTQFGSSSVLRYTSTIFATKSDTKSIDKLYDVEGKFGRGSSFISGVYDTQDEDFGNRFAESKVGSDMMLALASAFVTMTAIFIHTKSGLLTLMGIVQITLSFPLAFGIYKFLGQLDFFPFLNFIGVFVVFALGADDVFVAVDKWKNARLVHPNASVEEIARKSLPEAADAMLLTTSTTAVAFFATAICPVAAIRVFSIFVGLLIVTDYIMCIMLVFPALVIYDNRIQSRDPDVKTCCSRFSNSDKEECSDENGKESLIRRILMQYYRALHAGRYVLLAVCVGAFVVSAIFAARMKLPTSSDVRILPSDNEFEKNYEWRLNILHDELDRRAGSTAFVVWGVTPGDTGNYNDPQWFTQLQLDEDFEPSSADSQIYLRDFCERFYSEDFASPTEDFPECAMNKFDDWLSSQSTSSAPDQIWVDHCDGANSVPVPEEAFDDCMYNWSQQAQDMHVLSRNGKVAIMYIRYNSRVRFDSSFEDLKDEWNLIEDWMNVDAVEHAPGSVKNRYFTSIDYWWYDTNGKMINTAYVASAIAIATASLIIFVSSRSFVMMVFSAFTIAFILASVTAMLVAFGWTLGFLEAIVFAVLIGLSCDFVIHFSHAYTAQPGEKSRQERTKHALIQMGPSILAAGATSVASATVMLFTTITFFVKFGVILFVTIAQATIGAFVVFLVLSDTLGPSNPTKFVDWMLQKVRRDQTTTPQKEAETDSCA